MAQDDRNAAKSAELVHMRPDLRYCRSGALCTKIWSQHWVTHPLPEHPNQRKDPMKMARRFKSDKIWWISGHGPDLRHRKSVAFPTKIGSQHIVTCRLALWAFDLRKDPILRTGGCECDKNGRFMAHQAWVASEQVSSSPNKNSGTKFIVT